MTTPAYAPPAPPSPQLADDARAALGRQVGVRAHAELRAAVDRTEPARQRRPAATAREASAGSAIRWSVLEIGSRARKLPAPTSVVWTSLVEPRQPTARPWLNLKDDEVEPRVLSATKPDRVVWSTLWPSRPNDEVHFELTAVASETLLRFTLLTPDDAPDESKTGHLRRRLNELLFADLRFSYGQ